MNSSGSEFINEIFYDQFLWVLFGAKSGFFGSLKMKSFYFLRLICLFSGSLFYFQI